MSLMKNDTFLQESVVLFKVVFAYLKHHEKLSSDLAVGPTGSHVDQQNLISQANHTCPVQGSGGIPTKQVIRAKRHQEYCGLHQIHSIPGMKNFSRSPSAKTGVRSLVFLGIPCQMQARQNNFCLNSQKRSLRVKGVKINQGRF